MYNFSYTNSQGEEMIFSVSDYVKILDEGLKAFKSKIIGEISEVKVSPKGHVYFTLKDEKDESIIDCVIWKSNYRIYGIKLEQGMKIIAGGRPSLHPKFGFKFIADVIELAGEGLLKKEYEKLKKKLEEEGLFAQERKKPIPEFPKRIGLITSESGAVIHDFLNNLGKYGYQIKFIDSRVEGQAAAADLISAVDYFRKNKGIDVLVIIRGGGSLESLQAFNNEILVRKVASCDFPVICGIGHDKDVPLLSLAADKAVSTPTAATKILDEGWRKALEKINSSGREIVYSYQEMVQNADYYFQSFANKLNQKISFIFQKAKEVEERFRSVLAKLEYSLKKMELVLSSMSQNLIRGFNQKTSGTNNFLDFSERQIINFDPKKQLERGYSVVYTDKGIIKSINQAKKGDEIKIRVVDGKLISTVEKSIKNDN